MKNVIFRFLGQILIIQSCTFSLYAQPDTTYAQPDTTYAQPDTPDAKWCLYYFDLRNINNTAVNNGRIQGDMITTGQTNSYGNTKYSPDLVMQYFDSLLYSKLLKAFKVSSIPLPKELNSRVRAKPAYLDNKKSNAENLKQYSDYYNCQSKKYDSLIRKLVPLTEAGTTKELANLNNSLKTTANGNNCIIDEYKDEIKREGGNYYLDYEIIKDNPGFLFVDAFSESSSLIRARLNSKWGYIDSKLHTIIPFMYDSADRFREGLALVYNNFHYSFIDSSGDEVYYEQSTQASLSGFQERYCIRRTPVSPSFLKEYPALHDVHFFYEYLNDSFKVLEMKKLYPPYIIYATQFSFNRAIIGFLQDRYNFGLGEYQTKKYYSFLTPVGSRIGEFDYIPDLPNEFELGRVQVGENHWRLIDTTGNFKSGEFRAIMPISSNAYAIVQDTTIKGLWGVLNLKLKDNYGAFRFIISPKFDSIGYFIDGFAKTMKRTMDITEIELLGSTSSREIKFYGITDIYGNEFVKPLFDRVETLNKDTLIAYRDSMHIIFYRKGNLIASKDSIWKMLNHQEYAGFKQVSKNVFLIEQKKDGYFFIHRNGTRLSKNIFSLRKDPSVNRYIADNVLTEVFEDNIQPIKN